MAILNLAPGLELPLAGGVFAGLVSNLAPDILAWFSPEEKIYQPAPMQRDTRQGGARGPKRGKKEGKDHHHAATPKRKAAKQERTFTKKDDFLVFLNRKVHGLMGVFIH